MKRKLILAGNWKMYKTIEEAKLFIQRLVAQTQESSCSIFIAPSFTSLEAAVSSARGSSIIIGAQNMHDADQGAFTGEVSAKMLLDVGARFVILGHSERRHLFKENDAFIQRKIQRAQENGLISILCIGESLEEREEGQTFEVLATQLEESLKGLTAEKLLIAYEPVWAIGTGRVATPEIAQETHRFCRKWLDKRFGKNIADQISILYGGSVKPENIAELANMPDIDGALVGGASLEVDSFVQIAKQLSLCINN